MFYEEGNSTSGPSWMVIFLLYHNLEFWNQLFGKERFIQGDYVKIIFF